ncbi:hypothetical protein HK105_200858 [Polyrhizophydium stewartii]|uniref:Nicotinamide-nucleotide adenylyltransferase n=1 Tax=Polyrhizophydium stewartii TaxID=2732419 RepID=A0ABR4NIB9_9FUNG
MLRRLIERRLGDIAATLPPAASAAAAAAAAASPTPAPAPAPAPFVRVVHPTAQLATGPAAGAGGGSILVFDSSFNPPTMAHMELVRQAIAQIAPLPADAAEPASPPAAAAPAAPRFAHHVLLLATNNMDKPVSGAGIVDRLEMMCLAAGEIAADPPCHVALTNQGRFVDKLHALQRIAPACRPYFVVGADTLVRLLDARYYPLRADSAAKAQAHHPLAHAGLRSAMRSFFEGGGRLVCAGRSLDGPDAAAQGSGRDAGPDAEIEPEEVQRRAFDELLDMHVRAGNLDAAWRSMVLWLPGWSSLTSQASPMTGRHPGSAIKLADMSSTKVRRLAAEYWRARDAAADKEHVDGILEQMRAMADPRIVDFVIEKQLYRG